MNNREKLIELLAQTIAPRLFKLFGKPPEEMGFPIYDTKGEVEEHLQRQFNPVEYWTDRAREIAVSTLTIMEAGGLTLPELNVQAMLDASAKERPDVTNEGKHLSMGESLSGDEGVPK